MPSRLPVAPLLPLLVLICQLSTGLPAKAGEAVGESIWNQQNAIDRAMQAVPSGATVSATNCQSVEVGTGNYRYICTLTYSEALSPSR